MSRKITTDLDNILSLIDCAESYGFDNSVLMSSFAEMIDNKLTDDEINTFANGYLELERYEEEDVEGAVERLTDFRDRYCK